MKLTLLFMALSIGPADDKAGNDQNIPLGPLGGWVRVRHGESDAEVTAVKQESPAARAGLLVGDRVFSAGGEDFPIHTKNIDAGGAGPEEELGNAIERAESGERGELTLGVRRGEEEMELAVRIPLLGAYAEGFPAGCVKSRSFQDGICAQLVASQQADGRWKATTGISADRYTTALCAIALLGRGDPDHLEALGRAAEFLARPDGTAFLNDELAPHGGGLDNWAICVTAMYLSEYVIATGDEKHLPSIQRCADALVKRMTEGGRFGHAGNVGYGGKGLNIINTQAQLAWALAERAGCEINQEAWEKSLNEIRLSTGDNGGVRYWTLQTGYSDASARTASAALALFVRGEEPELQTRMAGWLSKHSTRLREAHAVGSIGMIYGTCALRCIDEKAWRGHMDGWAWYLNLMRQPDLTADYLGSKRNNGGDSYLRKRHVAAAICGAMLATGDAKLAMCGGRERGWMKPREE
jgi:hypothetical protein